MNYRVPHFVSLMVFSALLPTAPGVAAAEGPVAQAQNEKDALMKKLADAVEAKGAVAAIETWKLKDLKIPVKGEAATLNAKRIARDAVAPTAPNGETHVKALWLVVTDKRYLIFQRIRGPSSSISMDESSSVLAGRIWFSDRNVDMPGTTVSRFSKEDRDYWAAAFDIARSEAGRPE